MPDKTSVGGDKLKVFISYSRRDLDFADQLVAVLSWHHYFPIIDRQGIHGAERWEKRLGQLILESDVIVFVLSPDSAASKVCAWEVDEAVRRGKRIIPVLACSLRDQAPHQYLQDLNYIHFYSDKDMPGSGFGTGLVRLIDALSVDIGWLREHTRIEELAARWEENRQDSDLLIRGSELTACKNWRDRRPSNAPELTTLQRSFLAVSEEQEEARANTERRRLEEIDAAQQARQVAIEEREAAFKRETEAQNARARARRVIRWGSIIAGITMITGALTFAVQQQRNSKIQEGLTAQVTLERNAAIHQKNEAERNAILAQKQKATVDELIRRIRIGISEGAGVSAMKKICNEAISVTALLASTDSEQSFADNEQRFLELYFGSMNLIEIRQRTDGYSGDSNQIVISPIESAMVLFKRKLDSQQSSSAFLPRTDLKPLSLSIEEQCQSYLP